MNYRIPPCKEGYGPRPLQRHHAFSLSLSHAHTSTLNPTRRSYENFKVELVVELAFKKSTIYAFLPINL
jgi:hypothetical protein